MVFATERVWGDNLSLSTVELRYAMMDFRTALLLLARNAKHVIFRWEMYWRRSLQVLESSVFIGLARFIYTN